MIIYFLRHASAGDRMKDEKKDERRPLDNEGVRQATMIGRMLAGMGITVDAIVSSPLKRAMQTASLVGNELGHEGKLVRHDALLPDADWTAFRDMLASHSSSDVLLVVGHNPSITDFFTRTIAPGGGRVQLDFKKGAIAKVEMATRGGDLQWLVTPKVVRAIQSSVKSSDKPKTRRK
jgi:phosphohistidine phosphatase